MDLTNAAPIMGSLVGEDTGALRRAGLPVTNGSTHLAHFVGPSGAIALSRADPNTPAESILSAQLIKANLRVSFSNK